MAVQLIGDGGLFTRLGKLFGLAQQMTTHAEEMSNDIDSDLAPAYVADPDLIANITRFQQRFLAEVNAPMSTIRVAAIDTVVEMVNDDVELPSRTLALAMSELISQMEQSGDSIASVVPVYSFTLDSTAVGNGVILGSIYNGKGLVKPTIRNELLRGNVTSDAQVNGTPGREAWSIAGEATNRDRYSYEWGNASGSRVSLTTMDPARGGSSSVGNQQLTNGSFDFWLSGAPTGWAATVGGGTFVQGATAQHDGSSLEIVGDGTTLSQIKQQIGASGGTLVRLRPSTRYIVGGWFQDDGTAPTSGTLQFSIKDGNDAILDSGQAVTTVDMATVGSDWAHQYFEFSTPADLPESAFVVIELTTALTSGRSVFVDQFYMARPRQLYGNAGITLLPVRGSIDWIRGDTQYDRNGAFSVSNPPDNTTFAWWLDRMLNTAGQNLIFPASDTPTIPDALIS